LAGKVFLHDPRRRPFTVRCRCLAGLLRRRRQRIVLGPVSTREITGVRAGAQSRAYVCPRDARHWQACGHRQDGLLQVVQRIAGP
jgi:hypothetical protein